MHRLLSCIPVVVVFMLSVIGVGLSVVDIGPAIGTAWYKSLRNYNGIYSACMHSSIELYMQS